VGVSAIFLRGAGAVSPAGWGVPALREALRRGKPILANELKRPGWPHQLRIRNVPLPASKPPFMAHARLRRSSLIAQFAVSAALEALGTDVQRVSSGSLRLGVIFCAMAGCVNYSRRFYDEILKDPATASPLIFPETVFNAPASHLAALLGTSAINYTLVGDQGTFLQGLGLAADWLLEGRVDGCLIVGAEELDWLVAEAFHLFDRQAVVSDGAGAIYLSCVPDSHTRAELKSVTDTCLFSNGHSRLEAAKRVRAELTAPSDLRCLLCDGLQGVGRLDCDEIAAWKDWPGDRLSPKTICGESLMAAAAWQCAAAFDAITHGDYATATISVVGVNQQAIAAEFVRSVEHSRASGSN
jgi:3-oxoacyl-(acyl-carrier-protein) synthase